MTGAVRLGDISTGHDGFHSRANDQASSDVIINGIGAHRVGDHWPTHCNVSCHDGVEATGSNDVIVNGKPLARIGDKISCGDFTAQGSSDVIIN
jgi:uncharacterized Zn-binding protein involved in type VI secretion